MQHSLIRLSLRCIGLSVGASRVVVMEGSLTLERRRERLAAAHSAVQGLEAELWRAGGEDLGPLLGELDALAGACDAAKVAVVSEAEARG